MRLTLLICSALLMMTFACKPKDPFVVNDQMLNSVPDSVIVVDSMINILTDIQLAEAYVNEMRSDSIPKEDRLKQYYSEIFSMHHIDGTSYKRSYDYYVGNPILMNHIYVKVTEKLNLMESEHATVKKNVK
ncbi:MAG TPA: DUF4296 domain-containing protein [Chitinophagales bacterium]|nr:DUF4296 domain-containing protein [Chitinophagales bacterium]HNM28175.1 DUF4296 domain-containing protein [Chitinophagales bacterium]